MSIRETKATKALMINITVNEPIAPINGIKIEIFIVGLKLGSANDCSTKATTLTIP